MCSSQHQLAGERELHGVVERLLLEGVAEELSELFFQVVRARAHRNLDVVVKRLRALQAEGRAMTSS